jgi:hypothetical protein
MKGRDLVGENAGPHFLRHPNHQATISSIRNHKHLRSARTERLVDTGR